MGYWESLVEERELAIIAYGSWFDESLNMKVYRRSAMDFGDSQASLALSIAQIKFIAPLLSYFMSLIIVVFCRFADNYSSSVQTATEYKLVAKDLKEAHETLSIPSVGPLVVQAKCI